MVEEKEWLMSSSISSVREVTLHDKSDA
jgi:hypothetical protein